VARGVITYTDSRNSLRVNSIRYEPYMRDRRSRSAEQELTLLTLHEPVQTSGGVVSARPPTRSCLAATFASGVIVGASLAVLCLGVTLLPSLRTERPVVEGPALSGRGIRLHGKAVAPANPAHDSKMISICVVTLTSRCKYFGSNIVRNLQRSTYRPELLELLVINQGTEDCALPPDPRLRYVFRNTSHAQTPLLPTGSARNELLAMATGEVVVVMDDDDLYGAGYIDFMVRQLFARSGLLISQGESYSRRHTKARCSVEHSCTRGQRLTTRIGLPARTSRFRLSTGSLFPILYTRVSPLVHELPPTVRRCG
jgi:hypothetical protein